MTQHHFLIGPPASGKSTLAQALQDALPHSGIISTDDVRAQLYGDPAIQGHWDEISGEVQQQCKKAIATGKTIIYDATNAKRPWRYGFLRPFLETYPEHSWVGWYLKTSVQNCMEWNRQRQRRVPDDVIQSFHEALKAFPPDAAEGMVVVQEIAPDPSKNLAEELQELLPKLQRRIINQNNVTKNSKRSFHAYSDLLDFERLLYLIKVLLEYPGVGNLREQQPDRFPEYLDVQTDLDELCVLLSEIAPIYSDRSAVVKNLEWLHRNGFLSAEPSRPVWDLPDQSPPPLPTHGFSSSDRFLRLMGTVRFMLHHPFYDGEGNALDGLTQALQEENILSGSITSCRDTLRKDIQLILKPYGLLKPQRYKRGYFLGTGIFSHAQLLQLHQLLAGQAKSLADPTVLDLFNTLSDRLQRSKLSPLTPYPVRALYNFTIINQSHLPHEALANTIDRLEQEIEAGQSLELQRFAGVGRHGTEPESFFQVWPVQIVFQNIGWYLGYEVASGDSKGLLQFERLDRLFRGRMGGPTRARTTQEQACQHLQKLFQSSGGLFLGTDPSHQRQWLNGTTEQRKAISVILELWCSDRCFRFISEGDQRFPLDQMKLSPRLPNSRRPGNPRLFRLKPTGDPTHPHRCQITLPYWALKNVDLQRWIWGFKDQMRVVSPDELVVQIREELKAIAVLYGEHKQM